MICAVQVISFELDIGRSENSIKNKRLHTKLRRMRKCYTAEAKKEKVSRLT